MIRVIASVTLLQVGRQRRMLLLGLLASIPILVAVVFRFAASPTANHEAFAVGVLGEFVVNLVLPLSALLIGTSALGQDLEDGTIVYLLAKPLARWRVVVAKITAAWLLTYSVVLASVLGTGGVVLGGDATQVLVAFAIATAFGALAYVTIFVTLSLRFSRALVFGLAYVFVWEALLSRFIVGVQFLSVRAYTIGIVEGVTEWPPSLQFPSTLGPNQALVLLAIVVTVGFAYSVRMLTRHQIAERV